jgi:hypothetical protein
VKETSIGVPLQVVLPGKNLLLKTSSVFVSLTMKERDLPGTGMQDSSIAISLVRNSTNKSTISFQFVDELRTTRVIVCLHVYVVLFIVVVIMLCFIVDELYEQKQKKNTLPIPQDIKQNKNTKNKKCFIVVL